MTGAAESLLRGGINDLGLSLDEPQVDQLLRFQALIEKWTKVYNLTSVRDPLEMVTRHLLDSLAIVEPLERYLADHRQGKGARLLDVGSGAGLPGVVVSICLPDVAVTCIDTVAKKTAFIRQAALALDLSNLFSVHGRVEALKPAGAAQFDIVCCRAFSSLADFTAWSGAAMAPEGVWLAMKGKQPADELNALSSSVKVFHVEQLQVPGMDGERCIVWMRKSTLKND